MIFVDTDPDQPFSMPIYHEHFVLFCLLRWPHDFMSYPQPCRAVILPQSLFVHTLSYFIYELLFFGSRRI